MYWIDKKYALLLSDKLDHFKIKKSEPLLINCRCFICGDSQKNKRKARGYIISNDQGMSYVCHNCNAVMWIGDFIKLIDESLYSQYILEKYSNKYSNKYTIANDKPVKVAYNQLKDSPLDSLQSILMLDENHKAKQYVSRRRIPTEYFSKLFYAPKFKTWINSFLPGKFADLKYDEDRLIIPLLDQQRNFIGCQGRSFLKETDFRYITTLLDPDNYKVYGLESVNDNELFYVLEGPIDSMFVDNSIAMCGSNISIDKLGLKKNNAIFVYDNQPRNFELIEKIEKTIEEGYKIVLFPKDFKYKDVNEAIMNNYTKEQIHHLLKNEMCEGLQAKLKFSEWRKD